MVLSLAEVNAGVPFTGTKPRFSLVSHNPTWIYHRGVIDGTAPKTGSVTSEDFEPVVTPGRAEFASLTGGGLFRMAANYGLPMVLEAIDTAGGATFITVDRTGATLRPALDATKVPYTLAPGEIVKASGGTYAGILVRLIPAKTL